MRNFTGIQMLRGLAALAVVCGHSVIMRSDMGVDPITGGAVLRTLQSGVDVFFVISGFIIAMTASRDGETGSRIAAMQFIAKRFVRLYPIYWVVLAAAFASSYWIATGPARAPTDLSARIIFMLTDLNYYVPPAWSLYYEISFYAVVAVALLAAPRHVTPLSLTVIAVFAFASATDILKPPGVFSNPMIIEFGFGLMIAMLIKTGARNFGRPLLFASGILFTIGAFTEGPAGTTDFLRVATFGLGAAFLVYAVVTAELSGKVFPAILQRLGDISYSLYLVHFLLFMWGSSYFTTFKAWLPGEVQIVLWIATALITATAAYYFIERPLLGLSSKLVAVLPLNPSRKNVDIISAGLVIKTPVTNAS